VRNFERDIVQWTVSRFSFLAAINPASEHKTAIVNADSVKDLKLPAYKDYHQQ